MGNSNGNFDAYWSAIDGVHGLQGGFIWDWADQVGTSLHSICPILKSSELGFKVIFPSRSCYLQSTYGLCPMHFGELLTMGPDAFRGF